MNISRIKGAIYNKVWLSPKTRLSCFVKRKCDELPHKQRLTVVTVMLTAFIFIAFFVFGHACYKMGLGHRSELQVEHVHHLDVSKSNPVNPVTQ
ncbi:MAG: TraL conjugative transposon family protein [Paramuribaculum sp.]|nr:TraL conjugative transposon family protein [Paramuribaculum sp.]